MTAANFSRIPSPLPSDPHANPYFATREENHNTHVTRVAKAMINQSLSAERSSKGMLEAIREFRLPNKTSFFSVIHYCKINSKTVA